LRRHSDRPEGTIERIKKRRAIYRATAACFQKAIAEKPGRPDALCRPADNRRRAAAL